MRRTKAKTKGYEVAFQKGKTDPIVEAWVHTTHQTSSSRRAVSQKKKKKNLLWPVETQRLNTEKNLTEENRSAWESFDRLKRLSDFFFFNSQALLKIMSLQFQTEKCRREVQGNGRVGEGWK